MKLFFWMCWRSLRRQFWAGVFIACFMSLLLVWESGMTILEGCRCILDDDL